jgi:hypothetical protein
MGFSGHYQATDSTAMVFFLITRLRKLHSVKITIHVYRLENPCGTCGMSKTAVDIASDPCGNPCASLRQAGENFCRLRTMAVLLEETAFWGTTNEGSPLPSSLK